MSYPRSVLWSGAIAGMLWVGGPGTAQAKESRFSVKNCTEKAFDVKVYDGDDTVTGDLKQPRKTYHLTPGERQSASGSLPSLRSTSPLSIVAMIGLIAEGSSRPPPQSL